MKFEKIDGVQYIVLENNDEICITTPDSYDNKKIEIKRNNEGFEISGNSSIVSSIRGEGMLEKVYIPPVISKEEIIKKCDTWLEMFKQVHDAFKKLVLTDKYREQDIVMRLDFSTFFSFTDRGVKGGCIDLDLKRYGIIFKEGVTISIDEANKDIYSYLVASVLNYYVSKNLKGTQIDLEEFNGALGSNNKRKNGAATVPMLAGLGSLIESPEYRKIIDIILYNHNLGESSDQLIANLKNRIFSQQIGDRIDNSIEYSSEQCEYVLKK